MTKHILQSQAWNDFQRNIGRKTFYKEAKDYSYLAILEQTKLGNYLFVPYGPAADTKKGQKAGILALKELATREKAIFVRIEPLLPLSETDQKDLNLQKTKDIEPKYTRIIDLTRPEEEILAAAKQKTNPNLDKLFRAVANTWASTTSRQMREYLAVTDVHAPDKLRCNRVLQTLPEFYETYDIRPGDGMWTDPASRVSIW